MQTSDKIKLFADSCSSLVSVGDEFIMTMNDMMTSSSATDCNIRLLQFCQILHCHIGQGTQLKLNWYRCLFSACGAHTVTSFCLREEDEEEEDEEEERVG